MRNIDSKIVSPGFDYCAPVACHRVLQQNLPQPDFIARRAGSVGGRSVLRASGAKSRTGAWLKSDSSSAAIHRELRAMDETRAICREEHDGFSDLVRRAWTVRRCLSGQSLETFAHGVGTFGASHRPS